MRELALIACCAALTGCVSTKDVVEALAKDPASICASVSIAFPPFANTVKACRTNSPSQTATMDAAGNPSVVQTKP